MRSWVVIVCAIGLFSVACNNDGAVTTTLTTPPATTTTPTEANATTTKAEPDPEGAIETADTVFTNGVVVTQEDELGLAEAIAVSGERIIAVGNADDINRYIGPETTVIDLEGRAVTPGFVDPHTHILTDTGSVAVGQPKALEAGITTIGEGFINGDRLRTLVASSAAGELKLRTNLYLVRTDNCGGDQGHWYEKYAPETMLASRVRVAGVKVFADGGTCGPLAVSETFLEGYENGLPFSDLATMEGYIRDADEAGYQVLVHAIGDLAIEQAMDAYENVLGPGGAARLRHRIDHNSFTVPRIVDRYDGLGVVGVLFGWIDTCDLGDGWTDFYYDYGDDPSLVLDANPETVFAWHGDDPWIGPVSPLIEMFNMVTRAEPRDGEICRPTERLTHKTVTQRQAFDMMTTGSAYALTLEDEVGSLAPGKYADMLILTQNPLTVEPDQLLDIEVLMTMIGGEVEHCVDRVCEPLFASGSTIPEGSGECVVPPEGIVSWWTGDDGATDLTGENQGDLTSGSTIAEGVVNGSFRLESGYVTLDSQPNLDGGFTLEAWVNFDDAASQFQTIFNNNQVFIRRNSADEGGGLAAFVKLDDGSVEPRAQSTISVKPDTWYHLGTTWDGSNLTLYVDGTPQSNVERAGSLESTTVEARIGSGEQLDLDASWMTGFVDEFTFYERPLDAAEISAIFAAGTDGKCRP